MTRNQETNLLLWIKCPQKTHKTHLHFSCRRGRSVAGWSLLICTMDHPQTPPIGWIGKEAPLENSPNQNNQGSEKSIKNKILYVLLVFLISPSCIFHLSIPINLVCQLLPLGSHIGGLYSGWFLPGRQQLCGLQTLSDFL